MQFTWVDDYAFLTEHKITYAVPWVMLQGNDLGHTSVSNARAVGAGSAFRPLATTVRDTLAWWPAVPQARRDAPRFAITPEQEKSALARGRQGVRRSCLTHESAADRSSRCERVALLQRPFLLGTLKRIGVLGRGSRRPDADAHRLSVGYRVRCATVAGGKGWRNRGILLVSSVKGRRDAR
ncbi:MAG: hypothetical protein ACT4P6_20610 [Gemmatimonadaceae bacterium]